MKTVIVGDALSPPTGLIVHGCNAQGVMGGGIALAVKNKYPEAYDAYRTAYETSGLELGTIIPVEVRLDKWIINAITQDLYGLNRVSFSRGRQVSYDAVAECFYKIVQFARTLDIDNLDIIYPLIGAGLGGGNWFIIDKIIDEAINGEFNQVIYGFKSDLEELNLI